MRYSSLPFAAAGRFAAALLLLACAGPAAAQNFGPASPLVPTGPAYPGNDYRAQITSGSAGNWVVVWNSEDDLNGGFGWDLDILVARSADYGATWSLPTALNAYAATDGLEGEYYVDRDINPQVTTDRLGNWVAVWESNHDLGGTIGTDGDILVARSTDNGASWTAPAALNTTAASDTSYDVEPQVTTNGAGIWLAVWTSNNHFGGPGTDPDILMARSTDNGATWTAPAALNTNSATDVGYDTTPQVTTDNLGNWVAVWTSDDDLGGTIDTDEDILVARSTNNGDTWTAPVALNTNAATDVNYDALAQVTTDGMGKWVAVWQSADSLGSTIGTDADVLVARSTDNGVTWTPPAALNTNAASDVYNDEDPQVATDGAGKWVAVWTGIEGYIEGIAIARSSDDGVTWSAPETLTDGNGHLTASPQVMADGAYWAVNWDDAAGVFANTQVFLALVGVCGDGAASGTEECDEDGPCCTPACEFENEGVVCPDDGIECTTNVCDGAGSCGVGVDALCDDSDACTADICETGLGCQSEAAPIAENSCLAATGSKLQITDSATDGKDKLSWQWSSGAAFDQTVLGTPAAAMSTTYTLCVYDTTFPFASPVLKASLDIPSSESLWTSKDPKGLAYKDKAGTARGVEKAQIKTGLVGKTKVKVSAGGTNLDLPDPYGATFFQQSPRVIVQLVNSEGTCWTSKFAVADTTSNEADSFKAQVK